MPIPVPYHDGGHIGLEVCQSDTPDLSPSQRVSATINKVLSMTMSPVLDITIPSLDGGTGIRCVLKLYDRRVGTSLRASYSDDPVPHTPAHEAAFLSFVERGMMPDFMAYLSEANTLELQLPPVPRHFLDGTTEGRAKYEAGLWRECNEHFRSETQAYTRLASHQGKSVPRMLAHVRLAVDDRISNSLADLPLQAASYFEVRGILLELLDGYNLEDLTTSPLAPPAGDMAKWQQIIQSAVDLAHEVNELGIILQDCAPRNVVVDGRAHTPYMVDLAQCLFRDELVVLWHKWNYQEEEGWDQDVEYWKSVNSMDNTKAIGLVMADRVRRATGVELEIQYPNFTEIRRSVRREKAEAAGVPCVDVPSPPEEWYW